MIIGMNVKESHLEQIFLENYIKPIIMTGNEAFTRGLYEAGVQFLANYPGTPTSEIGDMWRWYAGREVLIDYDLSINETVAFEAAVGASWTGIRAAVVFKHLGMNLISDALHSVMYSGIEGQRKAGLVIICGGDPGIKSSTNAQDVRLFSFHSKLPILEPASIQECKDFVSIAFELSEKINLPVMIYSPASLNHASSIVQFSKLSHQFVQQEQRYFRKDFNKFLNAIHWAQNNQTRLNSIIFKQEQGYFELEDQDLHSIEGKSEVKLTQCTLKEKEETQEKSKDEDQIIIEKQDVSVGIITSGLSWTYSHEICAIIEKDIPRLRLLQTYPINKQIIVDFVDDYEIELLLVIEEQEPFLEMQIKDILYDYDMMVPILGKNIFPREGTLSPQKIIDLLSKPLFLQDNLVYFEAFHQVLKKIPNSIKNIQQSLPIREPTFCPGCSHRNVFYSLRKATDKFYQKQNKRAIFGGDIGCYTLGMSEPYAVMDWLICMGAGVGITNGVGRFVNPKTQHVVSLIGDSTFFHSGIQAIYNLAKNNTPATVVILDNYFCSMTGHQISPSTPKQLNTENSEVNIQPFKIKQFLETLGTYPIKTLNGYSIKKMTRDFLQFFSLDGLKFILVEAECALNYKRRIQKETKANNQCTFLQIADHCTKCDECFSVLGCTAIQMSEDKYKIDTSRCLGEDCLSCLEVCPNHAIYKTVINPHLHFTQPNPSKENPSK
ncbi:Indolepyruvate oxidoreductase subunit IorA [Candidatus Lokiarchaeum ossiferum]|uniref:Indolepyruvate oxidoreductase subunit IorA n=1 Tax=Candidatus Lokiarchaeum ossiferum TaxID=2951803 RepID=A0ABY6HY51_9ARCH|nr:Indolepyruvate oxidoreductase subunit IorA [Candidatus Lokiarchaeum sp. B-35]